MNSRTLTRLCQLPGVNPRHATSHRSFSTFGMLAMISPSVDLAGRTVVRSELEREMNDAAIAPLPHGKTATLEDREHGAVLTQHVGFEMFQILAAGEGRQMS